MSLLSGHLQTMVSQPSIRILPVSRLVRILGVFDNEKADNPIRSPAGAAGKSFAVSIATTRTLGCQWKEFISDYETQLLITKPCRRVNVFLGKAGC